VFSLFRGVLALSTSFWLSMALLILTGVSGIAYSTAVNSLLQLNTPEQLRGRVLSITVLQTQGRTPLAVFSSAAWARQRA